MNYRQSLDYLLSFADFERSGRFQDRPDVAPLLTLLRELGEPQAGRRTVHVTGSKGKGSVAAMVESVVRAAGQTTGLFTSPHLHSFTERVRIDGEPLAEADWAGHAGTVRRAVEAVRPGLGGRSFVTFDLMTALAFLAFRERGVAWQVLEVGLGGRVDSTNVVDAKDVCAFTAIGLEHTDVLGDTVEAIAAEKAGIIVPGATVVIGPQEQSAARDAIAAAAAKAGCETIDLAERYRRQYIEHNLEGQTFRLERPSGALTLRLPLLGAHQLENAATAVAIVDALTGRGLVVPGEAIERGLARVSWPGRLEVLRKAPLVIADGAHSRESARCLRESLTHYFSSRDALLVVGMLAGKDVHGLARELAPVCKRALAVRPDHPRAMAPEEVAAALREAGVEAEIGGEVGDTVEKALAVANNEAVICVTGSLTVAAEGRARLYRIAATA